MYIYICYAQSYGSFPIVKIGISKNPEKRLKQLKVTHDHLMKLHSCYLRPRDAREIERYLKDEFKDYRRIGEECFSVELDRVVSSLQAQLLKRGEFYHA